LTGQTFFNVVFYEKAADDTYERRIQQPGFDFPLVSFDPKGQSIVFVFDQ
jgi:hypothetical protein